MSVSPTPRSSLEHARKAAKALLRAARSGDPEALSRVRAGHPRKGQLSAEDAAGLQLADAQLVVARERGAASWPKLKALAEAGNLDAAARIAAILDAAVAGRLDSARDLLGAQPELVRHSVHLAAALGEDAALSEQLSKEPGLANAKGGPRDWPPLLYLGLSRFLGRDAERSAGMRRCASLLLEAGADPNAHTVMESPEFKQTPLYGAAGLANDPELTALLLEAGADPNDQTEFLGPESLYHASEHADNACLRLILEAGPEPDKVSYCLGRKLDFEDPEGLRLYLSHGADPNFRNPFGDHESRLHKAIRSGRSPEIVALLLEAGADPNARTQPEGDGAVGRSSLALALRSGRPEIAELLLQHGADADQVSDVDRFLDACAQGDAERARRMLAEQPALMESLEPADHALLPQLALEGRVGPLGLLLDLGFPIEAKGDFGTGLNMAAWRGQLEALILLLEAGADTEAVNEFGGTALGSALHGALYCHDDEGGMTSAELPGELRGDGRRERYVEIVRRLLEAGADPGPSDRKPIGIPEIDALLTAASRNGRSD